jgi:peroxiredoxin
MARPLRVPEGRHAGLHRPGQVLHRDEVGLRRCGRGRRRTEHKDFCNKFSFTIELLADPGEKLLGALGVGQSEWKGTKYWDRTTFLVDPTGVVRKVYTKVDPNGHEHAVLKDIAALKG